MAPGSGHTVLDANQLADALIELPGWELKGKQIVKAYPFDDYSLAVEFANAIATLAQKMGHYPDIHLSQQKVKVYCWTPRVNAVTSQDTALAGEVDRIFESG